MTKRTNIVYLILTVWLALSTIPISWTARLTSWCIPLAKLTVRQTVLFGILGALTFAAKWVMSALPNTEPVSLMIMLFAV